MAKSKPDWGIVVPLMTKTFHVRRKKIYSSKVGADAVYAKVKIVKKEFPALLHISMVSLCILL